MLNRQRTHDEEEEFDACFDAGGKLRDGVTRIKVPLRMMDSARDLPKVRDADGAPLGQPGFTRAAARDVTTARDARNALYDQYDVAIANQWKTGDASTIKIDAANHTTADQIKDVAYQYQAYDTALVSAWRRAR